MLQEYGFYSLKTDCVWNLSHLVRIFGFWVSWWLNGEEPACHGRRPVFNPWVGKIPWRRKWQPTPVFLPGKSHEQRSLVGYSPWSHRVRHDWVHTSFSAMSQKFQQILLVNTFISTSGIILPSTQKGDNLPSDWPLCERHWVLQIPLPSVSRTSCKEQR